MSTVPVATGLVKVLFVRVSVPASVAKSLSVNAVLNSAVVPVIVLTLNAIDLLVKVWLPLSVATVPSIAISFAFAVIPVPPITLTVTSPDVPPPVKPVPATTDVISPTGTVATCVSTYALIDCCVAKWLAEFEDILSSSLIPVPLTPVFITGLVNVLADNVCVPVSVATVASTASVRSLPEIVEVIPEPPKSLIVHR